jgi:hypothetical protein
MFKLAKAHLVTSTLTVALLGCASGMAAAEIRIAGQAQAGPLRANDYSPDGRRSHLNESTPCPLNASATSLWSCKG